MRSVRPYYEAYDDRYRQVHSRNLLWFSPSPTPILSQVLENRNIGPKARMLEIGCGEGRDARFLLARGYDLTATDISPEAVAFCRAQNSGYADRFQVLDCVAGHHEGAYEFIYAVAVLHMLVEDDHRSAFFRFFREHLTDRGIGLICTMGDGTLERSSGTDNAFTLQSRTHEATGTPVMIAGTTCRMVSFPTFLREIQAGGLTPLEHGITSCPPDFPTMMYALVTR